MKFSFQTVLKACCHAIRSASLYTVIMMFVFWFLQQLVFEDGIVRGEGVVPGIPFSLLWRIFLISLLIAFSQLLFKIDRLPKFIAYILNYATVLIGFFVVFNTSIQFSFSNNAGKIFVYALLLTVCYIVIALAVHFLRRSLRYLFDRPKTPLHTEQSADQYESML